MKPKRQSFGFLFIPLCALALSVASFSGSAPAKEVVADPAETHSHDGYTAWTSTNSLPNSQGSYYLTTDVSFSGTWSVPSGTVNLCLNGHGIRKTGSGSLISIASGATLSIDDCGETVHYFDVDATNHYAKNINENEGSGRSSFNGGYITGCAGIYAIAIAGGTLNLNGGTIIGNYQNSGGKGVGVNVGNGGTFNMHGGTISYNYCQNAGGGVMVRNGNMYMDGGVITHNKTGWAGGSAIAVHFTNESDIPTHVRISGGVIENNYTQNTYGAIDMNTGKSNIFEIEGSPRIRNNWNNDTNDTTERNISLRSDYSVNAKAKLSAPLEEGADMSVRLHYNNGLGAFTEGWTTHMQGADPADYFFAEDPTKDFYVDATGEAAIFIGGEGALVGSEAGWTHYQSFADAVNAWGDGQTLKLLANASYNLAVSSGTKTLDLNDCALTASGSSSVVIVSGGNLTIKDGSKNPTTRYYICNQSGVALLTQNETEYSFEGGYIGGGVATQGRGGGLRVLDSGTVNFVSGTLFGNSAGWGGGIWCAENSVVNISGTSAIIGNYSSGQYTSGGGIFCEGNSSVTMTGGSIRHNSAQWSGGGIRNCIPSTSGTYLTITGGEITGNYSGSDCGNGYAFDVATTLRIGGSVKIYDNQGADNLRIGNDKILEIVEPFTDEADIHVRVDNLAAAFTTGWTTIMGEEADPADYFVSDIQDYKASLKNGEVILSAHTHSWSYSADGNVITASCGGSDCEVGNQTLTISAEGKAYDGNPVVATLSFSNGWTAENDLVIPSASDIVYSGNEEVGTYTASITIGGVTASVEFSILHAHQWTYSADGDVITAHCTGHGDCEVGDQTLTILADDKPYDGTPVAASLAFSDGWTAENGLIIPNVDDVVYSGNTDAGTYTASITVGGATASTSFTIETKKETEVDVSSDMPGIVIEGLEEESQAVANQNPDANQVKVAMKVESKTEENAPHAEEIREEAGYARLQFFSATVEKTVDGQTSSMDETSNVLEIAIPYAYTSKRDIAVYSYHDGETVTFARSDSKADGTFSVNQENGMVYVYTKRFSTFAISYTPYYNVTVNVSLGAYEGTADVKLENVDGSATFTKENVAMGNVLFEGVAIGLYRLTITWVDGHSNTISRIISVGGVPIPENQ